MDGRDPPGRGGQDRRRPHEDTLRRGPQPLHFPRPGRPIAQAKAAEQKAIRKIVNAFIDSCVEAASTIAPAEIAAATTHLLEPIGQNRRARLSNGTCANAWGSGPVIPPGLKYAGPAGPDSTRIDILAARRLGEERPFAVLTSYASHPHLYALPYFSGETIGPSSGASSSSSPAR